VPDDPPRYRNNTLRQLQDAGDALALYDCRWCEVSSMLRVGQSRDIAEQAELGGRAWTKPRFVRRSTILGRARELKLAAYYGGIRVLLDEADPDLATRWDYEEIDAAVVDGHLTVTERASGKVIREYSVRETMEIDAAAYGYDLDERLRANG
jgi:hypothetical protein